MSAESRMAHAFAESHPLEAARALEPLPEVERHRLIQELPLEAAVAVLRQMETSIAATALAARSEDDIAAILAELPVQHAARLLERFETAQLRQALAGLPAKVATPIQRAMHHPEDSAGALMDPRVFALPSDITAGEARKRVLRQPRHVLYYLYVVDRDDRLVGVINLRELMLAAASIPLASIMKGNVESVSLRASHEAILAHPAWRDVHALPVVDREGVLTGVLRYETQRRLEADSAGERDPFWLPTGLALGEVYWSAATALLLGTFDALRTAEQKPSEENRNGA